MIDESIMIENIPAGIHCCASDSYLTLLGMSNNFLELCGYTKEEILRLFQNRFLNMIYPPDQDRVKKILQDQKNKQISISFEYRILHKDGTLHWILDKSNHIISTNGEAVFCCILIDVTEAKETQEKARKMLERYRYVLKQTNSIIFEWNIGQDTLEFYDNQNNFINYPLSDQDISETILHSPNIYPRDIPHFIDAMEKIRAGRLYSEMEFRLKNHQGKFVWHRIRATTQFNDYGDPIRVIGAVTNIESEKRQQQELLKQVQVDALTGLFNKHATQKKIEKYLAHSKSHPSLHALFMIDVDDFKAVNDRYGHICGDALLSDVAQKLNKIFRSTDVVGRIGGDEFMVFLADIPHRQIAIDKATLLIQALEGICINNDSENSISCSIGIAFSPQDATSYTELYHCADQALYRVKNSGKSNFSFYDKNMEQSEWKNTPPRSAIGAIINSQYSGGNNSTLAHYLFQILYCTASDHIEPAIYHILKIIGHTYDVGRVYIFENSEDDLFCNNTFEWCNDGIPSQKHNLQHLSYRDDLGNYLENFNEEGVFYCQNIQTLHPTLFKVLKAQGIYSLLQCAILEDGKIKGFLGFDEYRACRFWTHEQIQSLSLIARVLSTFLMKNNYKKLLNKLHTLNKKNS